MSLASREIRHWRVAGTAVDLYDAKSNRSGRLHLEKEQQIA